MSISGSSSGLRPRRSGRRQSHDFTGMTVIPFCTSGGSGAGRTGETLGEQAGTGTFLSSTRLSGGISDSELQSWIGQ